MLDHNVQVTYTPGLPRPGEKGSVPTIYPETVDVTVTLCGQPDTAATVFVTMTRLGTFADTFNTLATGSSDTFGPTQATNPYGGDVYEYQASILSAVLPPLQNVPACTTIQSSINLIQAIGLCNPPTPLEVVECGGLVAAAAVAEAAAAVAEAAGAAAKVAATAAAACLRQLACLALTQAGDVCVNQVAGPKISPANSLAILVEGTASDGTQFQQQDQDGALGYQLGYAPGCCSGGPLAVQLQIDVQGKR